MRIAFCCLPELTTFIEPIAIHFEKQGNEVRRCYSSDGFNIGNAITWAEVVWIEWANELAVTVTNSPGWKELKNKRKIIRLHSYEVLHGQSSQVKWDNVDDVIFVAEHVKWVAQGMHPTLKGCHVVPNGVDIDKWTWSSHGYSAGFEKNKSIKIAHIGNMTHKKGPMLLFHAFEQLHSISDCTLHLAGLWQETRFLHYFKHMGEQCKLSDAIFTDGKVKDINLWLQDKDFIICTSPWESQNMGLMEAMCCGIKPLIHHFLGADLIYKKEWLWKTLDDLIQLYKEPVYESQKYRDFVIMKYDHVDMMKKLEEIVYAKL
jgi:glycosyltransferase involved in cell wall biosynthesis